MRALVCFLYTPAPPPKILTMCFLGRGRLYTKEQRGRSGLRQSRCGHQDSYSRSCWELALDSRQADYSICTPSVQKESCTTWRRCKARCEGPECCIVAMGWCTYFDGATKNDHIYIVTGAAWSSDATTSSVLTKR